MISPSTTDSCINSMQTFTWWNFPFPCRQAIPIAAGDSTCPTDGFLQSAAIWVLPILSPHSFTAATSSASADERVTSLCVEPPGLHVIPSHQHSTTGGSAVRRQPAQPRCSFFLGSRTAHHPNLFKCFHTPTVGIAIPMHSSFTAHCMFGRSWRHAVCTWCKLPVCSVLSPSNN